MNKKLLCTAVGGALALTVGSAQAIRDHHWDSVLIPYVVKDTNRTTVVTLFTTHNSRDKGNQDLHLQYWTKSTTDANTAACQPNSVFVPVTTFDTLTFDTAGILGYPLFGDTTNPAPLGMSISFPGPRHGYLLIDDQDDHLEGGYWMELDLANGGAHGHIGFGNDSDHWFDDAMHESLVLTSGNGGDYHNNDMQAVPFWPSSVASTAFTVTPLGTDMLTRENNQVVIQVFNGDYESLTQGAYDRNENGVDGTVPQTVRCVGRVTPAQLMPGVVANPAWAAQGGYGYLANLGDNNDGNDEVEQGGTNSGDLDAIVYQVDTATAGGKFMSNATPVVSRPGSTYYPDPDA